MELKASPSSEELFTNTSESVTLSFPQLDDTLRVRRNIRSVPVC